MESMTLAQARRTALAAQGLHRPRPARARGVASARDVQRAVERLGVLQIDSVNVLARAHLVPLFSRVGSYDVADLDRAASVAPRGLLECWGHMASFVPPETYRLLAWRRRRVETDAWGSIRSVVTTHPDVVARVRDVVAASWPVTATQVHDALVAEGHDHARQSDGWGWNWSIAKTALEHLFFTGEIAVSHRTASFERAYGPAALVLPPEAQGEVTDDEAVRGLVELGARAHGVGTVRCFQDYFRLRGPAVRTALEELVDDGTLTPVTVRGWDERTYLHRDATFPRTATGAALLSPFDPLVFERTRLERLFGTRYRIEIYVPAERREHGYYVLPFLQGDRITARVDLKADRPTGTLRVLSAHREEWTVVTTVEALADELLLLAGWLGLTSPVVVERSGGLAAELGAAISDREARVAG